MQNNPSAFTQHAPCEYFHISYTSKNPKVKPCRPDEARHISCFMHHNSCARELGDPDQSTFLLTLM